MVVVWALTLVFVDWGAMLNARTVLPLVREVRHCLHETRPLPAQVSAWVGRGAVMRVREVAEKPEGICYRLEAESGEMGWVPWHPEHLSSAGIDVRLRW